MEFSNGNLFFTVRQPPGAIKPAKFMFYPGCQLPASSADYVEHAYRYLLERTDKSVGLMLGCCGAPADWAGRRELARENIERIRNVWSEAEQPQFILACSSCMSMFDRYLPEIQCCSLWETLAGYNLPIGQPGVGKTLTIHDACATRYNQALHDSVRALVANLGYSISELKYSQERTKCCGYGGLVFYANRSQQEEFARDRINESSDDFLVYCAMCKDLFVDKGKRTFHLLDLIFGNDEDGNKRMPTLSERHANRTGLKRKLLKDIWNEDANMTIRDENAMNLLISQEVRQTMEERFILIEDILDVLKAANDTQCRFQNPQDGSFLASLKKKNVTYWVKYAEKEDGIQIQSVYSHRMVLPDASAVIS